MSKIPYTIAVDRFVCSELELIRTMIKTYDFSSLAAVVERIQYHVSSMEDALYRYDGIRHTLKDKVNDDDCFDSEFRKVAQEVFKHL
jgi:hypothetical protein